jgi:hypothetical protein
MSSAIKRAPRGNGILPPDLAGTFQKASWVLAALGVVLGAAGFLTDRVRFGHSYLVGFMFTATICVGALLWVVILHLTKSGWSVAPRRILEWISQGTVALLPLFIPIIALAPSLWTRWMGDAAKHDKLVQLKSAYLDPAFFYARAAVFLVVWAGIATWYYRLSREQDETGSRTLSARMQGFAPVAILLLAISLTFAGFDWVMSLDPHWYSTMFGVYIFAGGAVTSLATLSMLILVFRKHGVGGDLLTVEHQHDTGKYLFGFTIFWAYIAFSQFMLIWYANIPEETIFFKVRWFNGWENVSIVLLFGHFILPFMILLSRTAKRTGLLGLGAGLLFVMHFVDMYWLIMPNLNREGGFGLSTFAPSWIDLGGLLLPFGLTAAWLSYRVLGDPAFPLKEPYIPEALKDENL